jgi:hypothetical protein
VVEGVAYLTAALCSLVWQNRNLNSFTLCENPYLAAIVSIVYPRQSRVGLQFVVVETRLTSAARWFKLHPLSPIVTGASETASEDSRNSSTPTTAYPDSNSRTSQPHLSSPQTGTTQRNGSHTVAMSNRPAARLFNAFRPIFRQPLLRRRVQTAASPAAPAQSKLMAYLSGPVGPKTVHFWYVDSRLMIIITSAGSGGATGRVTRDTLLPRSSRQMLTDIAGPP